MNNLHFKIIINKIYKHHATGNGVKQAVYVDYLRIQRRCSELDDHQLAVMEVVKSKILLKAASLDSQTNNFLKIREFLKAYPLSVANVLHIQTSYNLKCLETVDEYL